MAPGFVKVDSAVQTKETYYQEKELSKQEVSIQQPGVIDFAPSSEKRILLFLKTKACIATVKKVETLYKKENQDTIYSTCNLEELEILKNIAGGFQEGERIYVTDSEMALYAEDVGKTGVFIPDRMASEIRISGTSEKIFMHVECVTGNELILDTGECLSISRTYQKTFREAFSAMYQ